MIDWGFIEKLEGTTTRGYVPRDAKGEPLDQSGVTIGGGVDLGQWTVSQLFRRGVPFHVVEQLAPYVGLRRQDAVDKLDARPLVLTNKDAGALTVTIRIQIMEAVSSRFDGEARRKGRLLWEFLPPECQTVVASVSFQYGPALYRATPNFWRQVTDWDWGGAYLNLLNFGDKYPTRRRKEASLIAPLIGR